MSDASRSSGRFTIAAQHRVYAAFALHAISMGSLFPRLPAVRDRLGVEEGVLGLVLFGFGLPLVALSLLTVGALREEPSDEAAVPIVS